MSLIKNIYQRIHYKLTNHFKTKNKFKLIYDVLSYADFHMSTKHTEEWKR